MKRAIRILGEFYQDAHPYTLALGGDLSETPFLEDLEIPFRELGLFGSLEHFDRELGEGLGVRTADLGIDEVA